MPAPFSSRSRRNSPRPLLLAVLALCLQAGPARAEDGAAPAAAPPPGFEEALRPQQALIDVEYQGAGIGSFLATFRPGGIRFADPAALADAVPDLRDPAAIATALQGEIPTHADRRCGLYAAPDCGILEPEVAGVIFDPDRFRAVLFVAPDHRLAVERKCLPKPPAEPCFIQSVAAAAAGSDGDRSANLRSFTVLGLGAARLRADTSLGTEQGGSVERFKAEYDLGTWRAEGGLFRISPLPLLNERRFVGAGLTTTLDTLTDLDQAIGGALTVFLAERSQVEIYRDGRLLSARIYDPGTRDLYTAELPDGAYFVTLRIIGPSGTREESRFFAKSLAVPPADRPLWQIRVGTFVQDADGVLPEPEGSTILQGATRHRIADGLALGAELAIAEQEQGIGGVAVYLLPQAEMQFEGFATTTGDYGIGLGLRGDLRGLGFSGYLRRVWQGGEGTSDAIDPFDIGGTSTQASLALSYLTAGPLLGFRATYNVGAAGDATYAIGPSLSWPLFGDARRRLDLHVAASATDAEEFVLAQLRFRWGGERSSAIGQAGASGAIGQPRAVGGFAPYGRIDTTWRVLEEIGEQFDLRATAASENSRDWIGAGALYAGSRGRADVEVERDIDSGTRYAGNLTANLVGTGKGIALGGADARESAVVVSLSGDLDERFQVLVDEQPRGVVAGGRRLVVPLRPYAEYDVRIVQTSGGFADFDASSRRVVLYPGTVRWLSWDVSPVVAVFGRILLPDGRPLAGARLDEDFPRAVTDADGRFQVELRRDRADLAFVAGGTAERPVRCIVRLPAVPAGRDYLNIGNRTCEVREGR